MCGYSKAVSVSVPVECLCERVVCLGLADASAVFLGLVSEVRSAV